MKARWKILIAVAVFLMVFTVIWLATLRLQPENRVETYKQFLRSHGEKLTVSEVLPPPVAPESNCVDAVEEAFRSLGSSSGNIPMMMQVVAPGRALVGWTQPDVRGYDFTNSWEDFTAMVAADQPAIALLGQVLEQPKLDFSLDYDKGFLMLLPHLAPMKRAAQRLSAATICDLHNGDAGSAATNLCILLGLVRANQNEGVIISQLVRFAMVGIASSATWELLQSTNVTDAQLAGLQNSWQQLKFVGSTENAFLMERAIACLTIEKMRANPAEFRRLMGVATGGFSSGTSSGWPAGIDEWIKNAKLAGAEMMWRASWSYSEELHLLQADQVMLKTLRGMKTNQVQQADYKAMQTRLASLGVTNAGAAFFRALDIPDFSDDFDPASLAMTIAKMIRVETIRRVVLTAIALKRYELKHGDFPENLSALTPEWLPAVPLDPMDGNPLRYQRHTDGNFRLYSVGENGVDDGGDPSLEPGVSGSNDYWLNLHARDWVWPQPATPAEARAFSARPPK